MPKDYKILYKDLLKENENIMTSNDILKRTNDELNQMHHNSILKIFELRDQLKKLQPKEKK